MKHELKNRLQKKNYNNKIHNFLVHAYVQTYLYMQIQEDSYQLQDKRVISREWMRGLYLSP